MRGGSDEHISAHSIHIPRINHLQFFFFLEFFTVDILHNLSKVPQWWCFYICFSCEVISFKIWNFRDTALPPILYYTAGFLYMHDRRLILRYNIYNNLLRIVDLHLTAAAKARESPSQCALCDINCMTLSMQIHPSSTDKEPCVQTSVNRVCERRTRTTDNFLS